MANGTVIPSEAAWKGDIVIGGIQAAGEFKVFQSGGGWKFLFRKPLLQTFKAVHNYEIDEVSITGIGGTATLCNQIPMKKISTDDTREVAEVWELEDREKEEAEMEDYQRWVVDSESNIVLTQGPTETEAHAEGSSEDIISICINSDEGSIPLAKLDTLLKEIPTDFLKDNAAIFTWLTNPHNPLRIVWITKQVQYGEDLTPEELTKVKGLVSEYADIFACSLGEVIPVPGATHKLDILDGTTFNLRVHQRPLTPPQL
jgi:hypothetical protein